MKEKKETLLTKTGEFFKDAFVQMGKDAKAQHEVDKANLSAIKAETKATFEENRGKNSLKKAKKIAKTSWDNAHLSQQERIEKVREEQKEQIEVANQRIKSANDRIANAKKN